MSKNKHLNFTPAQLTRGKCWTITYYVIDPITQKNTRHRIKINHIKSIPERNRFARETIHKINDKLYSGWTPFIEKYTSKGMEPLGKALDDFLKVKRKDLKANSLRSYESFVKKIRTWLTDQEMINKAVITFDKRHALDFMDYCDNSVKSTTYNNYLNFFGILFDWLIEREYCSTNHFTKMKRRMTKEKERVPIDKGTRLIIKEHLEENDTQFLMVCLLVFEALIRPNEITFLKPKDFLISKRVIHVSSEAAKNKKSRNITITDPLMDYLAKWDFNGAANDEYIWGPNMLPGKTRINPRRFSKKWVKLREDLNLPKEMQLYSLRDSGIIQMLMDGVSPNEVKNHADHQDLQTTNAYLKWANPEASKNIIQKSSGF